MHRVVMRRLRLFPFSFHGIVLAGLLYLFMSQVYTVMSQVYTVMSQVYTVVSQVYTVMRQVYTGQRLTTSLRGVHFDIVMRTPRGENSTGDFENSTGDFLRTPQGIF